MLVCYTVSTNSLVVTFIKLPLSTAKAVRLCYRTILFYMQKSNSDMSVFWYQKIKLQLKKRSIFPAVR